MIRISFSKSSLAAYISHLDMMRCMSRLFSRANVPIWFTQGFNPHPYMVFSAALPIGISGDNEMLDIKLTENCDFEVLRNRMNEEAPSGVLFNKIYEAERSFSEISSALYTISVPADILRSFTTFMERDQIDICKKTKKGKLKVNLKDYMSYEQNSDMFSVILPCGNDINLGPNLLIKAYLDENPDKLNEFDVVRKHFFDKNGSLFE